jgi:hypothetical protein
MKKIYLSELACEPLTEYLESLGFTLHFMTGEDTPVYDAVKTHADIHMCQLGLWENSELFLGNTSRLGGNYPGNIIYNAVCTGKYFIHNLKYTDPALMQKAQLHAKGTDSSSCGTLREDAPLVFIDVPQGYTRCCCLPVDGRSFITSDHGIAKALSAYEVDVLLIEKGHIALPGFDYGFIGGCCGHVIDNDGQHVIVFNGDLTMHPDHPEIISFIEERGIKPVWFKGEPLMDIGSMLAAFC